MATVTKEKRQNGEHPEVTEKRAALASIRFELETIEREVAGIDRSDIVELHPRVKKKKALLEEQRTAEGTLRTLWAQHEAPRLIAAGYPDVTDAIEQYIGAIAAMFAARDRAVQARAAFNARFQESRRGVPRESDWENCSPPDVPTPPISSADLVLCVINMTTYFRRGFPIGSGMLGGGGINADAQSKPVSDRAHPCGAGGTRSACAAIYVIVSGGDPREAGVVRGARIVQ